MHIMTDTSDFMDIAGAETRPFDPDLTAKGKDSDIISKDAGGTGRRGSAGSSNDIRLEKDKPTGEDADEGAIESSEDEEEAKSSDEEEESAQDQKRGRGRSRVDKGSDASIGDSEESDDDPYASLYGQNKSTKQAKSALATAEEERKYN